MNKNQNKRGISKKSSSAVFASTHILIAVVALIECFLLISFTTYSWIETSSSLIIENGKQTLTASDKTNVDITDNLNFQIEMESGGTSYSDLDDFFSAVKYYKIAPASSANGKDVYFPLKAKTTSNGYSKNNGSISSYRKCDTTDYNTSFTYLDFIVKNRIRVSGLAKNYDFFFEDDDIFSASNAEGTTTFAPEELEKIAQAMRLSVQQGTSDPVICSLADRLNYSAQSGTATSAVTATNSHKASDYVYNEGAGTALFQAAGNADTKVSLKIWFESKDTVFTAMYNNWSPEKKAALYGVTISTDFRINYSGANRTSFYFEDYAYSSSASNPGNMVTSDHYGENNNYRVFFKCTYADTNTTYYFPMTDTTDVPYGVQHWATCDYTGAIKATIIDDVLGSLSNPNVIGNMNACFGYGQLPLGDQNYTTAATNVQYQWNVTTVPSNDSGSYLYQGFGAAAYSSSQTPVASMGRWAPASDDIIEVKFRDLATSLVSDSFNTGSGSTSSFKYITAAATATSRPVMYINILNTSTATNANAASSVGMYYDASSQYFVANVPTTWMTNNTPYFRYCPGGYYNTCKVRWTGTNPSSSNDEYIYTALGYTDSNLVTVNNKNNGYGTWGAVEQTPISISTELVDSLVAANQRFLISVSVNGNAYSAYYAMAPSSSRLAFSAYIPANVTGIKFKMVNSSALGTAVAQWTNATSRGSSSVFYPFDMASSATGYWNVAVLVDGTYEHLIYDTITNPASTNVGGSAVSTTGTLTASLNGSAVTPTKLDNYRWAVGSNTAIENVTWTWTPYPAITSGGSVVRPATVFSYNQNPANGIYYIVTEAADESGISGSGVTIDINEFYIPYDEDEDIDSDQTDEDDVGEEENTSDESDDSGSQDETEGGEEGDTDSGESDAPDMSPPEESSDPEY